MDLIINLQKYDLKKNPINLIFYVPHKIKDKKIGAFLETKNKHVETIIPEDFKKYNDKKELKRLVNKYDFFIAQGSVMPRVATTFGRVLGPTGKMPSPQLGIIMDATDKTIEELKEKINKSVKVRVKESSIKIPIAKQSMKDEAILENINSVYSSIIKVLPRDKENIKNIEIKFTMTKPQKIKIR